MLNYIRDMKHNILVKLVLGLIIMSFILVGAVNLLDINQNNKNKIIVSINDQDILVSEYYHYLSDLSLNNIELDSVTLQKIGPAILENIINNTLVVQEAKNLNLLVSQQQILDEIQKDFINPKTNKFDREILNKYLKQQNLTEYELFKNAENNLLIKQLILPIVSSLNKIPSNIVENYYRIKNTQYNIKYVLLDPDKLKSQIKITQPTIAELESTYNDNPQHFYSEAQYEVSYFIYHRKKESDIDYYDKIQQIKANLASGRSLEELSTELGENLKHEILSEDKLFDLTLQTEKLKQAKTNDVIIIATKKPNEQLIIKFNNILTPQLMAFNIVQKQVRNLWTKKQLVAKLGEKINNSKDEIQNIFHSKSKKALLWNQALRSYTLKMGEELAGIKLSNKKIEEIKDKQPHIFISNNSDYYIIMQLVSVNKPENIPNDNIEEYTADMINKIRKDLYTYFISSLYDKAKITFNYEVLRELKLDLTGLLILNR